MRFKNFSWDERAVGLWLPIWEELWDIHTHWEWQRGDFYYDPRYEKINLFIGIHVSSDLEGIIPLPDIHTIFAIKKELGTNDKTKGVLQQLENFIRYCT